MQVPEGGKQLDIVASPESGYTVSYLRAVVHHAKIYIRPMQKDLSLEPINEPVVNLCGPCSGIKDFSLCVQSHPKRNALHVVRWCLTSLREHIVVCKKG